MYLLLHYCGHLHDDMTSGVGHSNSRLDFSIIPKTIFLNFRVRMYLCMYFNISKICKRKSSKPIKYVVWVSLRVVSCFWCHGVSRVFGVKPPSRLTMSTPTKTLLDSHAAWISYVNTPYVYVISIFFQKAAFLIEICFLIQLCVHACIPLSQANFKWIERNFSTTTLT